MGWLLRQETENNIYLSQGYEAPSYGYASNLFTIKMHHSGFMDLNRSVYVDGKINYFDCCNSSKITIIELHDMARLVADANLLKFYQYNITDPSGINNFVLLANDDDFKKLILAMNYERMVEIFVDNVEPDLFVENQNNVINGVPDVGYNADEEDFEEESVDDMENEVNTHDQFYEETQYVQQVESGMIQLEGQNESSSSNTNSESDQSYSSYSDGFEDSDFDFDDHLYDENIDKEIEWVGFQEESDAEKAMENQNFKNSNAISLKRQKIKIHKGKSSQFPVYQNNADDSDFEFEVSLCFKTATEFREAIRKYSNKQGKPLNFKKNCSDKIQAICDCGWVIYASYLSKVDKTFQVKSIKGEHTCSRTPNAKHCTSKFLAKKYKHHIRSNPEWPVLSMHEIMQMENRTTLSISKLYRVKKHANKLNEGSELEQYAKLWDYCDEIKRIDPATTIKIKCKHILGTPTPTFKSIYICWGALKKGFVEGCRPVIGLDGTHLKTSRGGVLLTAVGIDGNNSIYPIAYAMVLKENTKSWEWFLDLLIQDLNIVNSYAWTIMSDKQKGLIKAVENFLPHAEHRFCLRHMYANFKKKHKGLELKELIWRAASATRVVDFNKVMEQLKVYDSSAYEWVKGRPPHNWSKSHFSCWPKSDVLLNNFCESFNHVILKARNKPIIVMLEIIRVILMRRMHTHRDKILNTSGDICPAVQKRIEENKKKSHEYIPEWNGVDKFEVKGWTGDKWTVDISKRICSCRKWDLTGIPCVHAVACLFNKRERVENYVEHWYTKDTFLKAYSRCFEPIKGQDEWPKSTFPPLVPWPEKRKKRGRPELHERRKEPEELVQQQQNGKKIKRNGLKYVCSNCGVVGHNKKGCKEPPKQAKGSYGCSSNSSKLPVKRKQSKQNSTIRTVASNVFQEGGAN